MPVIHAPDCAGMLISGRPFFSCGGVYVCPRCDREFGWCIGAYDDTPALCDECAMAVQFDPDAKGGSDG